MHTFMLQVACIDRGVGCTIWGDGGGGGGGGGVSYQDCASGDRRTAGTIAFIHTDVHAHTHTHTNILTKGPGSNVIMPGLAVSQLVMEDTA